MASTDYESVTCVKNEVFVFRIPARTSNRGYRAADWKLDQPDWTGRLKVVTKGKKLFIRLEDKNSGDLFASCPVEAYPGVAVEQVLDSSRYFVLKIQDESGRSAFIGIGFADRGDSFDLLVSLQDHFKWLKRDEEETKNSQQFLQSAPKLDLGFKEGQTIRINLSTKKGNTEEGDEASPKPTRRPRPQGGGTPGLLPPPPGGVKIPAPPKPQSSVPLVGNSNTVQNSNFSLLGMDGGNSSSIGNPVNNQGAQAASNNDNPWVQF